MFREFGVKNAFTMECSFCGPTKGIYKDTHFSQKLLIVSRNLLSYRLGIGKAVRQVFIQIH